MRLRVLNALIIVTVLSMAVCLFMPATSDQGQKQILAVKTDRSDGNIDGNILCVANANLGHVSMSIGNNLAAVPCVDAERHQGIKDHNSFVFNFLDDGWNDPGTKTAPADIDKGVLANANCDVPGVDQTIRQRADDEILWIMAMRAQTPIQGGDPNGGRAQMEIMANNSIIGPDGGKILTS